MKKTSLTLILAVISSAGFGQTTVRTMVYESPKYPGTGLQFEIEHVNSEQVGDYNVWSLCFQNMEYQYITDIGCITFTSEAEVLEFANKLEEFSVLTTENVSYHGNGYSLRNPFAGMAKAFVITTADGEWMGLHKKTILNKMIPDIRSTAHLVTQNN